jgi:DNA-binding transcriptional ArsR family regulator
MTAPATGFDPAEVFSALASPRRLQILEWLRDPVAHFPPQRDGDLIEDGVCVIFIADKLGVAQPTATAHLKGARPCWPGALQAHGPVDVLPAGRGGDQRLQAPDRL